MKQIRLLYILLLLTLGTNGSHIALFRDGTLIQQYPRQVRMLPLEDQRKLEQGIPIEGSKQLENLLQDYLS